jgi:diamine N-acetyltransferase
MTTSRLPVGSPFGLTRNRSSPLWRCRSPRLDIAAGHQGKGYGRFAVEGVLAEARHRGQDRATVLWVPGAGGPEEFYLRLGFHPTGELFNGEVVGALSLR